jgi:hypothetical protein
MGTATINGTIALESRMIGKPAIMFDADTVSYGPTDDVLTFSIHNEAELDIAIKHIEKAEKAEIYNLDAVADVSFCGVTTIPPRQLNEIFILDENSIQ